MGLINSKSKKNNNNKKTTESTESTQTNEPIQTNINNAELNTTYSHFSSKEQEIEFYKNELLKQQQKTNELQELITQFTENHKEYDEKINLENEKIRKELLKDLSVKRINTFVDQLLSDKNINITYLPDFVEKQIYSNIFTILIALIDNSTKDITIQFLGHQAKIIFTPIPSVNNIVEKKINNSEECKECEECKDCEDCDN
jgi:hypothetical protein